MDIKNRLKSILNNDLNKKIINSGFWVLLGNVLSKFILLVATILMSKYLGKEEYGQFGIIKSTILMFVVFAGLELGMTATKYIAQYKNTDKKKIENIVGLANLFSIILSLIVSFLVYFFAEEIALKIKAPNLVTEIQISSFILLFSSLNGIQNGILAGLEKFKELAINTTISGVLSSVLLVIASKYLGLRYVVIAFGANFLLLFILNLMTLKNHFYSEYNVVIFKKENLDEIKVLWKFSLPAILGGLMVAPVNWYCNYLLVNQKDGYIAMADFDIANQWRNTILFIPAALAQIVLPMLSSNIEDKENYRKIYNKNLRINFIIGFLLAIVFILLSPVILYFYEDTYQDSLYPMIIMFITTGFITINNVIGQGIASQDKMWIGFGVNMLWGIVLVISCYILVSIYKLGAIGISLAYLISYIMHTLVQFIYIRKRI